MASIFDQIHTARKGETIFDAIHRSSQKGPTTIFDAIRNRNKMYEDEAERIKTEVPQGRGAGSIAKAEKPYPATSGGPLDALFHPIRTAKRLKRESETGRIAGLSLQEKNPENIARINRIRPEEQGPAFAHSVASRITPFTEEEVEALAQLPEPYGHEAFRVAVRNVNRQPMPKEEKRRAVRQIITRFLWRDAERIQQAARMPAEQQRWREEAEALKGKFVAKNYRRWERGSVMVVGGGLHLAEELTRIATLGRKGDNLAEWADIYHEVLKRPDMQPVIENTFDKYFGGGVEMAPFLAATMVPSLATRGTSSLPRLSAAIRTMTPATNFLTTYGIESNLVYQGLKDKGYEESDARMRASVAGLISAGIEVKGGSGGKYFKEQAVKAATRKLGRFRYFSRKALRNALSEGLSEELPQEAVSMIMGDDVPKLEDGSVDWGKVSDRMIDTAIMGTTIGGIASTPVTAVEAMNLPSFVEGESIAVGPEAMAVPGRTYQEASFRTGSELSGDNPWIKQDRTKTNRGRTLLVQFASDTLTQDEDPDAKAYYDKLYAQRDGFERLGDTWEIPKWITEAANFVPDADVYFVRNMDEARQFLKSSGYEKVMFSALDVNAGHINDLASGFGGKVVVGGYVGDGANAFQGADNVTWYDSMEDMAKGEGYEYRPGINMSHFEGSQVVPRLCMSKGCKHKCAFCVVPKTLEVTEEELVKQQVDAFAELDARLVYLDDKTFGQAKNHTMLPDLYWRIKKQNPEFEGFIIQTTASQFGRFSDEFLAASHIRYVELGVETFNDSILRELHKPASEAVIQQAADRARRLKINLVPNIIIGLPQETAETYARTKEWLEANADIISHVNAYNLALYNDTEIAEIVGDTGDARDVNENSVEKSFHTDPEAHLEFAKWVYDFGKRVLDKDVVHNTGLTADQEIAKQYGVEPGRVDVIFHDAEQRYRELKAKKTGDRSKAEKAELAFLSRYRGDIEAILEDLTSDSPTLSMTLEKAVPRTRPEQELLERGHGIAQQMGMTEEERRMLMTELVGKNSMGDMNPEEMEQYVQYLEGILEESGQTYEPMPSEYYEMLDQLHSMKRPDRIEEGQPVKRTLQETMDSMLKIGLEFARLDRVFEWLDGGNPNGWFKRTFYRPLVAANTARNDAINQDILNMESRIRELGLDPGNMVSRRDAVNDRHELTGFERVGVYTLAMNPHTAQYLEEMGFTAQDVQDVAEFMSDSERALAEDFLDYYEKAWPILERVAISVGFDQDTLQQEVFYSPILFRDKGIDVEDQQTLLEYFEQKQKAGGSKPESRFLKKRKKPRKGAKIELDAMVMFVNQVNRFNTFQHMAPIAFTANKMLSSHEFGTALNEATGGMGVNLVREWIKRSVRGHGDRVTSSFWRSVGSLRDSGMAYALVGNIPTVIRQAVSLFNYAAYSPRAIPNMVRNMVKSMSPGGYEAIHEYARERTGMIRNRNMEAFVKKEMKTQEDLKQRYGRNISINETLLGAIRAVDMYTVTMGWTSVYQTARQQGMTEQEAIQEADEWGAKTQPMADAVYLPDIMGGRYNWVYRMMFPFTNQVNNNLNTWARDVYVKGSLGMTAYRAAMTWVLPSLVFGLIRRGRLQRDEKEIAVDLATYPVAPLMIAGDWIIHALEGDGKRTALHDIGFQSAANTIRAINRDAKTEKEKAEKRRAITKNAARTIGILGGAKFPGMRGIVTSQSIRSIEAAYDLAFSEDKPPARSLVVGKYTTDKYMEEKEDEQEGKRRVVK